MIDFSSPYALIIGSSVVLIFSFFFGEVSKKTSIPSVLMLIILGVLANIWLNWMGADLPDLFPILEVLGIVGLIMIVLEAALELKLDKEKIAPISMSFAVALIGLLASIWLTTLVFQFFIPEMTTLQAWIYATPLSILSSAIIIPSVTHLRNDKKEFHIYESTFSDILGIMVFYFLTGQIAGEGESHGGGGFLSFGLTTVLTLAIAVLCSYVVILLFQSVKSHAKQFLLLAVLLLLYSLGKLMHLSSLIIILIFGLVIANMDLFFKGPIKHWLNRKKAEEVYHGLHVVTLETAFLIRTFFFFVFGMTISFETLGDPTAAMIAVVCIAIIYLVRWVLLRLSIGKDIFPQLFIAPRGLITVLLFYAIPAETKVFGFPEGVLLYIIIGTGLIMTGGMIADKKRAGVSVNKAQDMKVGEVKWKAPEV